MPEIKGIDAVLDTYRKVVPHVKLLGPTFFAPLLREAKQQVLAAKDRKLYHILLILTDGEIHDMNETINEIAEIST